LRSPNIFITSLDEKAEINAKIGDFGLARSVSTKMSEALSTWVNLFLFYYFCLYF
jgi:hypothetical protein